MRIRLPRPRLPARLRRLGREQRGAIALMAALLALPLIGIIGLAIDFAMYSQTNSALTSAARAAALNAVKVAAAGAAAGNSTYVRDGQQAGMNWFLAQSGKTSLPVGNIAGSVTVTPGATITATLAGTAQVPSFFGAIFGVKAYKIGITAQAQETLAPYVEVAIMLDNSASMGIGATNADIQTLLQNTPCDPNEYYTTSDGWTYNNNTVALRYAVYECYAGGSYDGTTPCPVQAGTTTYATANNPPSSTPNQTGSNVYCSGKVTGHNPLAGPPCAFACHWDGTAGAGNDLWTTARKLGVTLRSDIVKNAVQHIISSMQTRSQSGTTLTLGIYKFDLDTSQVYPSGGEAANNWAQAAAAVGLPPVAGSGTYVDTGIQPALALLYGNNNNTNYAKAMTTLYKTYLTPAGNGQSASSPRKVLFLVTDGMNDDSISGARGAIDPSYCQNFKDIGYQVYVVYTPYYPLMHQTYLSSLMSIVEGTGTDSLAYNLQQCSSKTGSADLSTFYIQASDQAGLTNGLQSFLNSALASPARTTK